MFSGPRRRQKILILLTCCFALFMAMLDNTVVNVALPTLSRDLDAGVSGLQWIVDGYVLAFASLLLSGGIAGDRYGRKRMFLAGLAVFTLASLACGVSRTTEQLIAFRALQGVGAALLMPGTLSILTVTFPPTERAKAIGLWAGVSGFALSLGPTAGGWLVEHVSWQSVFFLNVPIGVVGLLVAVKVIPESRAPGARSLDVPGLVLGTSGLFLATFALIEANEQGWGSVEIVASLAFGAILLGGFVGWEMYTSRPMFPLEFFRIPAFSAGNLVAFAISFGMFGTFFFMSLYMQVIRGYTAFETGIRFLPLTAAIIVAAPNAGRLAQKYGSRWPMTIGLTVSASGLFLLSRIDATTPFALVMPILLAMGLGMGSTMTPMTAAVMNAVGPARAGLGSATTNTSREVGGVFGVALLGTLLTTRLSSALGERIATLDLPDGLRAAILESAGHGRVDPGSLGVGPAQMEIVTRAFSASFVDGFQLALVVASAMLFFAALVASRFIPAGAPTEESSARGLATTHS